MITGRVVSRFELDRRSELRRLSKNECPKIIRPISTHAIRLTRPPGRAISSYPSFSTMTTPISLRRMQSRDGATYRPTRHRNFVCEVNTKNATAHLTTQI